MMALQRRARALASDHSGHLGKWNPQMAQNPKSPEKPSAPGAVSHPAVRLGARGGVLRAAGAPLLPQAGGAGSGSFPLRWAERRRSRVSAHGAPCTDLISLPYTAVQVYNVRIPALVFHCF